MVRKINLLEKKWLDKLLEYPIAKKNIIKEQLKNAVVVSEVLTPYISLKFQTTSKLKYPYKFSVPINMVLHPANSGPIEFNLRFLNGFVDELEIYAADGTKIYYQDFPMDIVEYNTWE